MSTRSWTRQARRTNFSPEEILIAGVDFDTPADDPLRDEPSPTREAARDELLRSLRYGFFGSLPVTARVLPGRAEPVPVVVDGRRRVLLSREVNQERQAAGLELWTWSVEYRPDAGGLMFEVARRLNRGGVAETPAQVAHYLARMINQGASATYAAETLGIAPTMYPHYLAIAESATDAVRSRLDDGRLSVVGAATLARLSHEEQGKALELLDQDSKPASTKDAQAAARRARGEKVIIPPKRRDVRRALESTHAEAVLHPEFVAGVRFMLGDTGLEDLPDLRSVFVALGLEGES